MEEDIKTEETKIDDVSITPPSDDDNIYDIYPNIPRDVLSDLKEKYKTILGMYFGERPVLYRLFNIYDYIEYQNEYLTEVESMRKENESKPESLRLSDEQLNSILTTRADEMVVDKFVIYPDNFMERVKKGEYPGGCVYTLSQSIVINNGFTDIEPIIVNEKAIKEDPTLPETLDNELFKDFDDINSDLFIEDMVKPHNEVGLILFLNKLYIARGFKYSEYSEIKRISTSLDPIHLSVELVKRFTLFPDPLDLNNTPAGVVAKLLSDLILMLSGFGGTNPDIVIME